MPYFNILQNFIQNVRKPKWPSILSCLFSTKVSAATTKHGLSNVKIIFVFKCYCSNSF